MRTKVRYIFIGILMCVSMCVAMSRAMDLRAYGGFMRSADPYLDGSFDQLEIIGYWFWQRGKPHGRRLCAFMLAAPYIDAAGESQKAVGWVDVQEPFRASLHTQDGTLLGDIDPPNVMDNLCFINYLGLVWSPDGMSFVFRGDPYEVVMPEHVDGRDVSISRGWPGLACFVRSVGHHLKANLLPMVGGMLMIIIITSRVVVQFFLPKPGHCFRCGYFLHGNQTGICPECGTVIPAADGPLSLVAWSQIASRVLIWSGYAILGGAIIAEQLGRDATVAFFTLLLCLVIGLALSMVVMMIPDRSSATLPPAPTRSST